MKNFKNLLAMSKLNTNKLEGSIVEGIIVAIEKNFVTIDIGYKMSCHFIYDELRSSAMIPNLKIELGERILLFIQTLETFDGEMILNNQYPYKNLRQETIWNIIKERKTVNGRILNNINGGYSVGIGGIVAFLPNSLAHIKKINELKPLQEFKILKMNSINHNIVVSRIFKKHN